MVLEEHRNPRRSRRLAYQRARLQQGLLMSVILLGTILCLTLGSLLTPDRTYSDSENRKLAQFPKLSWSAVKDGSWFSDLESYTADQFAGRDFWIALRLRFLKLTGQKESNGVYLCSGDYLMEPPADPPQDSRNVEAINAFAARHTDLRLNMAVIPNAACILADKLPKNAPVRDQSADLTALAGSLQGISYLDVSAALSAHTDEQLYYRTDHHWTSLGACFAFEAAAEKLGIATPLTDYSIHILANDFEGTLASKSGRHGVTDTVTAYEALGSDVSYYVIYDSAQEKAGSMFVSSALDAKDKYAVFFGGNHPLVTLKTTANTGKVLLLFKDSYANCFVQFLIPYYDQIVMVDPRYYYDNADQLITQRAVTDVLFLYNDSTFIADTALSDTLNAGLRSAE